MLRTINHRNRYIFGGFFITIFVVFTAILAVLYYYGPMSQAGFRKKEPRVARQQIPYVGPSMDSLIPGQDFAEDRVEVVLEKNSGLENSHNLENYLNAKLSSANLDNLQVASIEPVFDVSPQSPNYDLKKSLGLDRAYYINLSSNTDTREVVKKLNGDNKFNISLSAFGKTIATPNDTIYNDPTNYPNQWAHDSNHYNSEAAWNINTGSTNTIIAYLDSYGFDNWNHPDLLNNIWQNLGEDADQDGHVIENVGGVWQYDPGDIDGLDGSDPGALVDDFIGWNYVSNNNNITGDSHGQSVMGTGSAVGNNNLGVVSLCWSCKAMPIKSVESQGIQYAVDHGADVINVSQISYSFSYSRYLAVAYAEAANVPVVSGGDNVNADVRVYPALFPGVINVSGTDQNDARIASSPPNGSSPFGAWHDVAASFTNWTVSSADSYIYAGGISHAIPAVASLIGLMKSIKPDLNNDQVRSIIRTAVDPVSGNEYFGTGRIDAYQAVNYVKTVVDNNLDIPVAKLDQWLDNKSLNPKTVLTITGTATSTFTNDNFDYYNLEYGIGAYPSSWTMLYSSTNPVKDGALGTINGNALPSGTTMISLRLTVSTIDPNTQQTLTSVDKTVLPINEKSIFRTDSPINGALTVGDINNDNDLEVVAGTTGGKIYVWNYDGTLLNSSWPITVGNSITGSPALGDLNNNGSLEIVAGAANSNVYVWDQNGNVLSGWSGKTISGQMAGNAPVLADLNNDGNLEVIVVSNNGHLYVWNKSGTQLWTSNLAENVSASPAVGDVDGDGKLEIVIGTLSNSLKIFNDDGSSALDIDLAGPISSSASLVDLNADGKNEIIIGTAGSDHKVYALKYDGSNYNANWPKTLDNNTSVIDSPAVGDIDNDGDPDVIVSTTNKIWAWTGDGSTLSGSWPVSLSGSASLRSMPIIADIDDDGYLEILISRIGSGTQIVSYVDALEADGTFKTGNWPKYTDYQMLNSAPLVNDLDDDGKLEILLGDGVSITAGGGDSLYVWWSDTSINTGDWPQRYHDARNTHQYGNHCSVYNDLQCTLSTGIYCQNGSFIPKCSLCGCGAGLTCLESGYCSSSGGGGCNPSCELE